MANSTQEEKQVLLTYRQHFLFKLAHHGRRIPPFAGVDNGNQFETVNIIYQNL